MSKTKSHASYETLSKPLKDSKKPGNQTLARQWEIR